jgi:pimeloyl-ACP methyl ester carboxylesterase
MLMHISVVTFRRGLAALASLACILAFVATARAEEARGSYIDLPEGKLWVIDTGGAGEPILLLHPRTGHSAIWENQISSFAAAGFRVIAPDKPGAGRSPLASDAKQVPYAETIDALADNLRLTRFTLVGAAEGGYFAFDYAAWKPERVRRLVLAASGLGVQVDEEGRAFRQNAAIPGFSKLPPEVRELSPTYRGLNPAGVRRWLEIEHQATPQNALRALLRTPNTVEKLAALHMPVLVIAGDVDLTTPSGAIRLWAKRLPDHKIKLITEAGHAVMWEQPDAFNEAVLSFIRQ